MKLDKIIRTTFIPPLVSVMTSDTRKYFIKKTSNGWLSGAAYNGRNIFSIIGEEFYRSYDCNTKIFQNPECAKEASWDHFETFSRRHVPSKIRQI